MSTEAVVLQAMGSGCRGPTLVAEVKIVEKSSSGIILELQIVA